MLQKMMILGVWMCVCGGMIAMMFDQERGLLFTGPYATVGLMCLGLSILAEFRKRNLVEARG